MLKSIENFIRLTSNGVSICELNRMVSSIFCSSYPGQVGGPHIANTYSNLAGLQCLTLLQVNAS